MSEDFCTIKVAFAAKSDAQAIEVKTKISEVLKDVEGAQLFFSLIPPPPKHNELDIRPVNH